MVFFLIRDKFLYKIIHDINTIVSIVLEIERKIHALNFLLRKLKRYIVTWQVAFELGLLLFVITKVVNSLQTLAGTKVYNTGKFSVIIKLLFNK